MWSDDKALFPIYQHGGGPPIWAIVMIYKCPCCGPCFDRNCPEVLLSLPFWIRDAYPLDPQYIPANKVWHLHRSVTDIFGSLMPTYGNGDLIARIIYEEINQSYVSLASMIQNFSKTLRNGFSSGNAAKKQMRRASIKHITTKKSFLPNQHMSMIMDEESDASFEYIIALSLLCPYSIFS